MPAEVGALQGTIVEAAFITCTLKPGFATSLFYTGNLVN